MPRIIKRRLQSRLCNMDPKYLLLVCTVFIIFLFIQYNYDSEYSNDTLTRNTKIRRLNEDNTEVSITSNINEYKSDFNVSESTSKWPIYWELLLKHSEALNLVVIDPVALECLELEQQKRCNGLYSNSIFHVGTFEQNFTNLQSLFKKHVENNETFRLIAKLKNDVDEFNTIEVVYTHPRNFNKTFFISILNTTNDRINYYRISTYSSDIAIRKFKTEKVFLQSLDSWIRVPENVDYFLNNFKNSEFVECNRELAEKTNETRDQKRKIPLEVLDSLTAFVDDLFVKTGQTAFLSFGTLLGWYRECDIIPHTHDLDLYVFIDEYPEGFESTFESKFYKPRHRIGMKDYGLEATFWLLHNVSEYNSISTDIFYLFDHNETAQWSPLIYDFGKHLRARCLIPRVEKLCSADLHGRLYYIPCNFEDVIRWNYGPRWNESYDGSAFEEGMQNIPDGGWNGNFSQLMINF